ncbi:MAG: OsmC family protein [Nocardioides sp.]
MATHTYELSVTWTGNTGEGTRDRRSYSRDHTVSADGPPDLLGSADPGFRGDPARWNPEQLFVASIAQCHMLWFLGLCAGNGVGVEEYVDSPVGTMVTDPGGAGRFTEVVLHPVVVVASADQVAKAEALHDEAHRLCFVAQSVSCTVRHVPETVAR